jgi:hypothetical protein
MRYAFMLGAEDSRWAAAVPGYFNIPRTADDTRVILWESFSGAVAESAAACARGVALAVRSRVFWPPAHHVPFDDFESLFHAEAASCVDLDSFTAYMEARE